MQEISDFFRFFGMIDMKQAQKNGPKSVFYSGYKIYSTLNAGAISSCSSRGM